MLADAVLDGVLRQKLVVDEEVVGHLRAFHVAVDVPSIPFHLEYKVKVISFVADVRLQVSERPELLANIGTLLLQLLSSFVQIMQDIRADNTTMLLMVYYSLGLTSTATSYG